MSEEEKKAIKYFKNRLKDVQTNYTSMYYKVDNLEILLNLIEKQQAELDKEKEKNKELEDADLTTAYMNGFYDGKKKWKDKIKEQLNALDNMKVDGEVFTTAVNFAKKILQELLEERN